MLYRQLLPILAIVLFLSTACKSKEEPVDSNAAETLYSGVFEQVWNTLDTSYVFFDVMPCDWDSLHKAQSDVMKSVKTEEEFKIAMKEFFAAMQDPNILFTYQFGHPAWSVHAPWMTLDCHDWIPKDYDTYSILNDSKDIGIENGTMHLVTAARINKLNKDTTRYNAIVFMGSPYDPNGMYKAYFKNYLKKLSSEPTSTGLIIDFRIKGSVNVTVASTILEAFYPEGETCTITAKVRASTSSKDLVNAGNMAFTGEGLYSNKPVVILVNEDVSLEEHVLASILSELPNVTIVGRSQSCGRGGICAQARLIVPEHLTPNILAYPRVALTDDKHKSLSSPLLPDVFVDWPLTSWMGNNYDKCLDAALDCIDDYHAKH